MTPKIFIELNCGDIFKYFLPSNIENDYIKKNVIKNVIFWCSHEKEFIKFLDCKSILSLSEDKIIDIFVRKSKDYYRYKYLFDIFFSYENYKRYICDNNVVKD